MSHYWILLFFWFGVARPQYINTAGPGSESLLDPLDSGIHYPPLPYVNYLSLPLIRNDYETFQNSEHGHSPFYGQESDAEIQRKRRTAQEMENYKVNRWSPNLIDKEQSNYRNDERSGQFNIGLGDAIDDNSTEILTAIEKRSFSPWGGKRADINNMWSWKRTPNVREPSMPKRVRFSPWGGKRSGQMIYKPESKSPKLIFTPTVPEQPLIVSNYPPGAERLNIAGLQYTSAIDKRRPIKVLALNSLMDSQNIKDMPFKRFLESLPKYFRPGQTYSNIYLKKDGKRKLKFSAWGGKRAPPIIGPIWAPTTQEMKDLSLDRIVLIRNTQDKDTPKAINNGM